MKTHENKTRNLMSRSFGILAVAVTLGALAPILPLVGSNGSAHAAACTDGGRTYHGVTMLNKYVELRGSSNCNGTAWLRWNPTATKVDGGGTIKFQYQNACGKKYNGESRVISSVGGTASHITAYKSGVVSARMVYSRDSGSPASFTGPWYKVGGKSTTC